MEEWRPIRSFGYNSETDIALYEVSNHGRVRKAGFIDSIGRNHSGYVLRQLTVGDYGIKTVTLTDGRKRLICRVHKLVADEFITRPNGKTVLRWKDGDHGNNRADNLFWYIEKKPNIKAGVTGRLGKALRVYAPGNLLLCEFDSLVEAARRLCLPKSTVATWCKGVKQSNSDLTWRYTENDELYRDGMEPHMTVETLKQLCAKFREPTMPVRRIRQYSLVGELVAEFDSVYEIFTIDSAYKRNIIRCCDRQLYYASGHVWRYEDDDELFDLSVDERADMITKILSWHGHNTVRQYDIDGKLIKEYKSVAEASNGNPSARAYIRGICKRCSKRALAYGFVWRYGSDDELYKLSESERAEVIKSLLPKE